MLVIFDKRLPDEAKKTLQEFCFKLSDQAEFLELETNDLVHPPLAGHPDIFFCKTPRMLIVSPDIPREINEILACNNIPFSIGTRHTGMQHPSEVYYSAAISDQYLVHHLEYTDPSILENCHYLKKIDVRQGYTSCSLMLLKDGHYLTSDQGIHKTLEQKGLKGIFISSDGILLPGFQNGQIGGTMGIYKSSVLIAGSLDHCREGEMVRNFLQQLNYSVIELFEGQLIDCGGILFPECE